MKTVMIPIADLRRPERNVRMHTDKQIKEFRRSIEMFGQIRPIVVDENNVMLAGNGLYETLLSMGRTEAACYVVTGLSEKEKKNAPKKKTEMMTSMKEVLNNVQTDVHKGIFERISLFSCNPV